MAEFKNEKLGVRLVVPDRPNVRQQLEYYAQAAREDSGKLFVRNWLAAQPLIVEWECASIPDVTKLDLETETDPKIAKILMWAGSAVQKHVLALEEIPKN